MHAIPQIIQNKINFKNNKISTWIFSLFLILTIQSEIIHAVQPIDADTLFFSSESEFHDFLEFYGLKEYDIQPPVVGFDCEVGPLMDLYTDQVYTDYLHEDYFTGMEFTILADHYGTTKIYTILMPTLGDPDATLCNVNLYIEHPTTGQTAVFYDIYNWIDENGQNIFNMNKKMYFLWGFSSDEITFDREMIQEGTGYDFTFPGVVPNHGIKLHFDDITIYNQVIHYADTDGDGFGDPTNTILAYDYNPPAGYLLDNTDCNDSINTIFPGSAEICNGLDDDCNSIIDDGVSTTAIISPAGPITICKGTVQTLTANSGVDLTYQWFRNDVLIAGAINLNYNTNKNGSYTVTVSNGICSSTSAPVVITTTPSPLATISNADGTTDLCVDSSIKLKANSGSDFTYQWYKDNVIISGATGITYFAIDPGFYKVKVTKTTNGCSKTSNPVEIINTCKSGIVLSSKQIILVSPNPSYGKFTVNLNVEKSLNAQLQIQVIDQLGSTKLNESIKFDQNLSEMDLSALEDGIYYLRIVYEGKVFSEMLQVIK